MIRILVVEDEKAISDLIRLNLMKAGYQCVCVYNGMKAADLLETENFDLIILDVMLPELNGFELMEYIRPMGIPVIFLTAKDEEKDVVLGFDLGADDYVIKPFRNRELVSRIRNVLRRTEKIRRLTCGNIAVEPDTGKVYRHGEPIAVTKLEYKILMTLFSNPHKIFTREEILNGIWDMAGNFVNDNTLTVTMKRLREKLGDKEGNVIVTVRGIGYRLNL